MLKKNRQFSRSKITPLYIGLTQKRTEFNNSTYYVSTTAAQIDGWRIIQLIPESGSKILFMAAGSAGGTILLILLFATAFYYVERRNVAHRMRAQEQRLQLALIGGGLGTWDWNIPSSTVHFNRRWSEMKGYEPNEITPRLDAWAHLVHPEDLPKVYEKLQAHFDGSTDYYEAEIRMRSKTGKWIWVLDRGKVMQLDENHTPLRVCGTHLDITLQKDLEHELRQEHTKLLTILDSAPVGVMIIGKDQIIRWVNRFALKMAGYQNTSELMGKQCE